MNYNKMVAFSGQLKDIQIFHPTFALVQGLSDWDQVIRSGGVE